MTHNDIDAVLAQYADAAASAEGARLDDWVRRFPQHADALVRFAVGDYVHEHGCTYGGDEALMAAEIMERAALMRDKVRGKSMAAAGTAGIRSLVEEARGLRLAPPRLAARLRLDMALLAKLDRRLIAPATVPAALVRAVAEALERTVAEVTAYLSLPPTLSPSASYRSSQAPRVASQESFADALAASQLPADDQRYWQEQSNPKGE